MNILLVAFLALLFAECNKSPLPAAQYLEWMNDVDHGLHQHKTIGRYAFDLQYKTPEYMALMAERKTLSPKEMHALIAHYGSLEQYTFRIQNVNGDDILYENGEDDYDRRLEYFVSYIQSDLQLVDGADTLPVSICNYERTYGLSPEVTLTIGFSPRSDAAINGRTFIFNDHLIGTGPVHLAIDKESFSHLPALSYEK